MLCLSRRSCRPSPRRRAWIVWIVAMWLQHQKIVSLALAWGVITGAAAFECYSRNSMNAILGSLSTDFALSVQLTWLEIAASRSQFLSPADAAKLVGCQPGITACCFNVTQYCDVDLLCHDRKTKRLSRQYCSDPSWPEDRCSKLCPRKPRPLRR